MTCLFTAYFVCFRRVGEGRGKGLFTCFVYFCKVGNWKEVMGNFPGYDLLLDTMFSFERSSSALKKKSFYPHISHQFSLPSVARLCGLAQQGSTGYFLVNNTNQP